jgi:hypothetical protein
VDPTHIEAVAKAVPPTGSCSPHSTTPTACRSASSAGDRAAQRPDRAGPIYLADIVGWQLATIDQFSKGRVACTSSPAERDGARQDGNTIDDER